VVPSRIVLSPDTTTQSSTRGKLEDFYCDDSYFDQFAGVWTISIGSDVEPSKHRLAKDGLGGHQMGGPRRRQRCPGKAFTYAFFLPAGHWEHHFHNQDARVAVVSGALKVAVGPELDKAGAKTYPAGSFLYVPANVQHTMGADVDTICIGTAQGPWKTHYEHEMHHPDW